MTFWLLIWGIAGLAQSHDFPVYKALKLDSAITLDGKLDEPIWNQAEKTSAFVICGNGEQSQFETTAQIAYDDENIYLAMQCAEPNIDALKALQQSKQGMMTVRDDAIELFFDPMATRAHFYQFIVHTANKGGSGYDGDYETELPFEAATSLHEGAWYTEINIPFAKIGVKPRIGDVWGMNLYRSRNSKGDNIRELLAWKPTGGGFRLPDKFGYLLLSGFPGNPTVKKAADQNKIDAIQRQITDEFAGRTRWSSEDLNFEVMAERAARLTQLIPILARAESQFLTCVRPPISDQHILPFTVPGLDEIEKGISVSACRGEYEPATFAVFASSVKLTGVNLEISDFTTEDGKTLFGSIVEPYLIKCWYQSGSPLTSAKNRTSLMAELLLKNPDLLTVDPATRTNQFHWQGEFPKDAETLQDVEIEPFESQQYWLTFHIPEDAEPGDYVGHITVKATGAKRVSIPIKLRVYNFELAPPRLLYSLYYTLRFTGCKTESDYRERITRMEAEIKNQVEHGINCPTTYVSGGRLPWDESPYAALKAVVDMHQRAGIEEGPFICVTYAIGFQQTEEQLESMRRGLRNMKEFLKRQGRLPLYVQGQDEASGERLKAERPSFAAAHEVGVKVFVACGQDYFPIIGDLLDMPVVGRKLNPELAKKVHANGFKILSYANPQTGMEKPELYRRNYGLKLWAAGYDGAMDWQYQGDGWDDFGPGRYRQETMTYPAIGKPVDTIQWEGWREGVDDVRYISTLLNLVDEAEKYPSLSHEVKRIRDWVKTINGDGDLHATRLQIIERIQRLRRLNTLEK